jgi:hypothetical protein
MNARGKRWIGWVGASILAFAPFIIDTNIGKKLAILGLFLLLMQAMESRLWNLIALNLFGIIGYLYALYF